MSAKLCKKNNVRVLAYQPSNDPANPFLSTGRDSTRGWVWCSNPMRNVTHYGREHSKKRRMPVNRFRL